MINQVEFNKKLLQILEENRSSDFEIMAQKIKEKYNWEKSSAVLYQQILQKQVVKKF